MPENVIQNIKIYTFDKNTIYEPNCIKGENIELFVEDGSNGKLYAEDIDNSGFDGSCTLLYSTFDINLQDIKAQCIIGKGAFQNRNELINIEVPNSVVQIGEQAFQGCDGLTSISLPFVGAHKDSEENFSWIFNNEGNKNDISDDIDLNNISEEERKSYYFSLPENLTTVNITGDIKTIFPNAFKGAKTLKTINLPISVTKIGTQAFYNTGIINLTIPDNVGVLGEKAFQKINDLKTVSWYTKEQTWSENNGTKDYVDTTYFDDIDTINFIVYGYPYLKLDNKTLLNFDENIHEYDTTTGDVNNKDTTTKVGYAPIVSRLFAPDKVEILQGYCGDNLMYTVTPFTNEKSETKYKLIITGSGDMRDFTQKEENLWYEWRENIIEVQLPENIRSIGDYAFADLTNLEKISLPPGIRKIGKYAFSNCENVEFSDLMTGHKSNLLRLLYLEKIGENAFEYCSKLKEFNCDGGVLNHIDKYAFRNCSALTTVILPDKNICLEESIFFNCNNIEKLSVPISSDIGKGTNNDFTKFSENYRKYNIGGFFSPHQGNNEEFNTDNYIKYNCRFTGTSYESQGVNNDGVRYGDSSEKIIKEITELYVPKSLKDITIRSGVMPQFYLYIGNTEFSEWDKVTLEDDVTETIYFSFRNNPSDCTNGFSNTKVIQSKSGRIVGVIAKQIELCDITSDTFCNPEGLLKYNAVSTNKGVTNNAKHYSYSKEYDKIICKGQYENFSTQVTIKIEELNLENSMFDTLVQNSFNSYMEVTNLVLPKNIITIQGTIQNNWKVQNIYQENGEGIILTDSVFAHNQTLQKFNCKIKLNNNTIPASVFYGCENLTYVKEIEGNSVIIGNSAFCGCVKLKELNFSANSSVERVGQSAFYNCKFLDTELPCSFNGLQVYDRAFFGCQNLKFSYLKQKNTVKIAGLQGIYQFFNCKKLQYIQFDSIVTTIPNHCFNGCNELTDVRVPDTITSIGQQAFQGYQGTWIELPQLSSTSYYVNPVTYYGLSYYLGAPDNNSENNLEAVYISNSTYIPSYAFVGWTKLKHVYFKDYKQGEETKLDSDNFSNYFSYNSINWQDNQSSIYYSIYFDNFESYPWGSVVVTANSDNLFGFNWKSEGLYYSSDRFVISVNGGQIFSQFKKDNSSSISGNLSLSVKKGDKIQFSIYSNKRYATTKISDMAINRFPGYPTNAFDDHTPAMVPEPYPDPDDLPWNETVAGGNKMRFLYSPLALTNELNRCMYLDYEKEYLWRLSLYGKQYDVYITDNNTYAEQYSYLPKLYVPNHQGIEVGQHIELQGENTYEIIDTQQFKCTGTIYYRQSQGVVNGKISYYGVSNGTLFYHSDTNSYEVDETLKKVLTANPIEFSTGYTYDQTAYKGKISMIENDNVQIIQVELDAKATSKEFEFGAQIALKNVIIHKATLKSELFSEIKEGSQFVVANSNQLQTVIGINETYEIIIEPGFGINTTGYNEISITLANDTRILSHDIYNNEVIMVINTKGNLYIEGALNEEVKKGKIDEHLVSLINPKNNSDVLKPTYFVLDEQTYIITKVDTLNNIIYFENKLTKEGYIINNQTIYDHEIQLQDYISLVTDEGFDTTDLHLTLNYINVFEVNNIKEYDISSNGVSLKTLKTLYEEAVANGEMTKAQELKQQIVALKNMYGLKDGEELYLIDCTEVVNPTNYEVVSRDLEKEAIMERYSTILTVENLDGTSPQHLLIAPNTNYYIYSNYIKAPPYYFETLVKQDIELFYGGNKITEDSIEMTCGSGLFEAKYEDNIASCTWSLQELYEGDYIEIDKVINQYSPNLFYNYHLFKDNSSYKLTVVIVTQDGLTIEKSIMITVKHPQIPEFSIINVTVEKDCIKQAIRINLQDIEVKIEDLNEDVGYKICPRSWLFDPNVSYKIDGLYVIRENLDEVAEDAVVTLVKGFPTYIYDYSFQREDTYRYSIIPIYHIVSEEEKENKEYILPERLLRGVPYVTHVVEDGIVTEKTEIQFNLKTIVLVGTEMDLRENIQENELLPNNYQVDKQPFTKWYFKYNTDARNVNIMTDKTVFETISQFATVNYSARNYKTGTVTAFLGTYHKNDVNAEWTYKDSIRLQNKFQEFANNGKIKMLRDEIGNVIPVDITLKSFEYNSHTIPTNITVSFEWTQVDTEKKLTVFETEDYIDTKKGEGNNVLYNNRR